MADNPYINRVDVVRGNTTDTLINISDTTAIASDVAQGKYFYLASGQKVAGTSTGGGGTEAGTVTQDPDGYLVLDDDAPSHVTVEALSVTANGTYTAPTGTAYSPVTVNVSGGGGGDMSDPIRFFDYDGTLVASYSAVPDSLPSVPTHDKLTNGAWNYTLAQVTTQFNAMGTCDVGANYDTVSGATEIDIELQEERLHPYLSLAVNGTVSIDWGDGTTPDTSTGTSLTTRKSDIHHEYAAAGKYTIKITKTSGTGYSLFCTATYILLNNNVGTGNANRVYSSCVKSVRVGVGCTIGNYAFYNCCLLESVSIPSSVTSVGNYAFGYTYSIVSVSLPSGITSIGNNQFYYSFIKYVSLPITITNIGDNAFYACYSLESVSIPSSVTSMGNQVLYNCYSIETVTIPTGVTSLGYGSYYGCYSLKSINLPSGLTTISAGKGTITAGFCQNCYSLLSIAIPSGVTQITANDFNNCYGMAEYHFLATTPPTLANTNAFTNIQSDCKIYVPAASLSSYQAAANWSTYASYMVGE